MRRIVIDNTDIFLGDLGDLLEEALNKIKQEKRRGGKWINFRRSVYKGVIPDLVRLGYGYRLQDGASHFTVTF